MWTRLVCLLLLSAAAGSALTKRDATRVANFRPNCAPREGKTGCVCTDTSQVGPVTGVFDSDLDCLRKDAAETAANKAKLNEEFKAKVGELREGCFPRPGQGCRCAEKDAQGQEVTKMYDTAAECAGPSAEAKANKQKLNKEFEQKYGGLKENCFPRPGKGCRCAEKDAQGEEVTKFYEADSDCKVPAKTKREAPRDRSQSPQRASQNVRDPVREKAQANYQAVINELKDKFRGLKEGCFPRPKGCMCVVGKDADGREITQRRMKEADCKCQPGERGPECPAAGA